MTDPVSDDELRLLVRMRGLGIDFRGANSFQCDALARIPSIAAELLAARAKIKEMEWRPIETLPGTDEQVEMWSPAGVFIAPAKIGRAATEKEKVKLYRDLGVWPQTKYNPTHWRPLPSPPSPGTI